MSQNIILTGFCNNKSYVRNVFETLKAKFVVRQCYKSTKLTMCFLIEGHIVSLRLEFIYKVYFLQISDTGICVQFEV